MAESEPATTSVATMRLAVKLPPTFRWSEPETTPPAAGSCPRLGRRNASIGRPKVSGRLAQKSYRECRLVSFPTQFARCRQVGLAIYPAAKPPPNQKPQRTPAWSELYDPPCR